MFSQRFNKTIVITSHAQLRMQQRSISFDELLVVIDTGDTRYKDETHLWVYKNLSGRSDNLVCAVLVLEDAVIVKTVMHHFDLEFRVMRTSYYDEDDILILHLSDKPIVREVSQDWNTHISYAADGSAVEIVVLDASVNGAFPFQILHGQAA